MIDTNDRSELSASSYQASYRWEWQGCLCPRRKYSQRRGINFGDISLATGVTTYCKHFPGCHLARKVPVSKSQSIQLSYIGLRRLLSTAIGFSFSLKTGAGGFSMCPNITLRSVVDRDTSPTFRALNVLSECTCTVRFVPDEIREQFREIVVQRIIRLYEFRRSSPRDTDIIGRSILHCWVYVSSSFRCKGKSIILIPCLAPYLIRQCLRITNLVSGSGKVHAVWKQH